MKLSLVVVAWQSRDIILPCLDSFRRHAPDVERIVVDNGSDDGTAGLVSACDRAARLLPLEQNRGFAGGCNAGARQARGDAILFVNPDVRATPEAVPALAAALEENPGAGAAGGLLVDGRDRPQRRYLPRPLPTSAALARALLVGLPSPPPLPRHSRPRAVGQAAGACLLVRRPDLEALGGFDAAFHPVYFEDVDLCRRLSDRGRRVLHVPAARFGHLGGGSVRRMGALAHESAWFGNLNRYAARHHGPGATLALRSLTPAALALRLAAVGRPGGGGRFGRRRRAAAYARVFLRSLRPWPPASPSTS